MTDGQTDGQNDSSDKALFIEFQVASHLQLEGSMVSWLVGVKRPFETVFQPISGRFPEREKEEKKDRGE